MTPNQTQPVTYTHKAWIGLCPVLVSDPDVGDDVDARARIPLTDWFLEMNLAAFDLIGDCMEFFGAEPQGYPIQITGKLHKPVTYMEPRYE